MFILLSSAVPHPQPSPRLGRWEIPGAKIRRTFSAQERCWRSLVPRGLRRDQRDERGFAGAGSRARPREERGGRRGHAALVAGLNWPTRYPCFARWLLCTREVRAPRPAERERARSVWAVGRHRACGDGHGAPSPSPWQGPHSSCRLAGHPGKPGQRCGAGGAGHPRRQLEWTGRLRRVWGQGEPLCRGPSRCWKSPFHPKSRLPTAERLKAAWPTGLLAGRRRQSVRSQGKDFSKFWGVF